MTEPQPDTKLNRPLSTPCRLDPLPSLEAIPLRASRSGRGGLQERREDGQMERERRLSLGCNVLAGDGALGHVVLRQIAEVVEVCRCSACAPEEARVSQTVLTENLAVHHDLPSVDGQVSVVETPVEDLSRCGLVGWVVVRREVLVRQALGSGDARSRVEHEHLLEQVQSYRPSAAFRKPHRPPVLAAGTSTYTRGRRSGTS